MDGGGRAQVHWPGKGGGGGGGESRGKIWNCVVLPPISSDPEADDETAPTEAPTTSRRASHRKYKFERELAELERQRTARELSANARYVQYVENNYVHIRTVGTYVGVYRYSQYPNLLVTISPMFKWRKQKSKIEWGIWLRRQQPS